MMDKSGDKQRTHIPGSEEGRGSSKTYKTIGHNAVQAFQRLHVFVREEKLNHSRVSEEVT